MCFYGNHSLSLKQSTWLWQVGNQTVFSLCILSVPEWGTGMFIFAYSLGKEDRNWQLKSTEKHFRKENYRLWSSWTSFQEPRRVLYSYHRFWDQLSSGKEHHPYLLSHTDILIPTWLRHHHHSLGDEKPLYSSGKSELVAIQLLVPC